MSTVKRRVKFVDLQVKHSVDVQVWQNGPKDEHNPWKFYEAEEDDGEENEAKVKIINKIGMVFVLLIRTFINFYILILPYVANLYFANPIPLSLLNYKN